MKSRKFPRIIFLLIISILSFQRAAQAQAGALDPNFGTNGLVPNLLIQNQDSYGLSDTALQPDGKIVVAGGITFRYGTYPNWQFQTRFLLIRYKSDGSLDPEFGTGGISAIPFARSASASSVSILPDGKFLAVGSMSGYSADLALARYNPDGSLDASFGVGGLVVEDFAAFEEESQEYPVESFILPDGRILVIGRKSFRSALYPADGIPVYSVFLARYNADGTPDVTFGRFGKVFPGTPYFCGTADSAVMQPDGKILVSDRVCKTSNVVSQLTRYNSDGSVDAGFGHNGAVRFPVYDTVNYPKVLPNGEIMVLFFYKITVLNADGSFNRDVLSGPVTVNRKLFSPFRFDVQTDGKIVSLGSVRWGSTDQIAVARFNPDGAVDTSFAARGLYLRQTNQPAALDRILIQPDGKILGIRGSVLTVTDIALMRLLGSSSPAPFTGKPLDR